ncbi:hypothetical protein GCM10011519_32940 [Marmoricola endophyticus]|uniref:Uncharacterized protein n=1 Tax=Marmoricola endophyticus TaxID=2040280 RepID=A0A917BT31_9ACTN|nr:DUF5719 family protein [Marmoricola endophyticus]GGF56392.1 hypothetical protein GCM10011519_32940 [Marmoricola endophyticus]
MTRAGGRRRADVPEPVETARRSRMLPVALVVLVLVVGVALWLAGRAGPVASPRGGESVVEPDQQQVVCPAGQRAGTSRVGLLPDADGDVTEGGETVDVRPGGVVSRDVPADQPEVLTATGGATRGLFATTEVGSSGLAGCVSPRASWWYAGAGGSPSHSSVLRLTNPGTGPAVLDVDVWGPDGEVPGPQLRGVSLKPGESRTLRLADLAPSPGSLAVHVDVSRGLVSSNLVDTVVPLTARSAGTEEDVPVARGPSRRVTVNGLGVPEGGVLAGDRLPASLQEGASVVLLNPGEGPVTARLRLSGSDGLSQPEGLSQTTVPPQSTVTVPLGSAVKSRAQALVVDADGPLVGGYQSPGARDLVHGVSGAGWEGPAAVALPGSGSARVELTARGGAAAVTLSSYDTRGQRLERRSVRVGARSTVSADVPAKAASVVVDSDGGVTGAVQVRRDAGTSLLRLVPLLEALRVPDVRPGG